MSEVENSGSSTVQKIYGPVAFAITLIGGLSLISMSFISALHDLRDDFIRHQQQPAHSEALKWLGAIDAKMDDMERRIGVIERRFDKLWEKR